MLISLSFTLHCFCFSSAEEERKSYLNREEHIAVASSVAPDQDSYNKYPVLYMYMTVVTGRKKGKAITAESGALYAWRTN